MQELESQCFEIRNLELSCSECTVREQKAWSAKPQKRSYNIKRLGVKSANAKL